MTRPRFDPATDYYRVLGVKPTATTEELHAAYRRLARAYHPDLHPGAAVARARMAQVNAAKSVLLDPETRVAYDLSRHAARGLGRAAPAWRATPTSTRRLDSSTRVLLAVVAPLVVALLWYVLGGVEVAAHGAPALACWSGQDIQAAVARVLGG